MDQVSGQHLQLTSQHLAHEVEEEHESLAGALRQRAVALWRAERGIRLYSAAAVVYLLACTALALFTDVPLPRMDVSPGNGHLLTIPIPVFAVSLLLFAIAWSYLLMGAAYSRWPIHLAGLALFTIFFGLEVSGLVLAPLFLIGALGVLALIWIAGFTGRLRHRGHPGRLSARLFVAHVLLVLLLYAVAIAGSLSAGSLLLFSTTLAIQLQVLQFFTIPVLVMSGTDFTEWGEVSGDWIGQRVSSLAGERAWIPLVLAGLVAVAVLADVWRQYGSVLWPQLAFGSVLLVLVAGLALAGRVLHHARPVRVPVGAVVAASAGYLVIFLVVAVGAGAARVQEQDTVNGLSFTHYGHTQEPPFSIQQPSIWEARSLQSGSLKGVEFSGTPVGNPSRFDVVGLPSGTLGADPAGAYAAALSSGANLGPAAADGDWQLRELSSPTQWGLVWTRDEGGRTWVLAGVTKSSFRQLNEPTFRHMTQTWSPDPKAGAAATPARSNGDQINAAAALVWLVLAALLALGLWLRPRLRAGLAVTALFLALVGVFYLVAALGPVASMLGLPDRALGLRLTGLRLQGVQALAAVLTLAAVAWFAVRRRMAAGVPVALWLLAALVGLQVISWMFEVFNQKQAELGLLQVALISLALAWDIVMSGGSMVSGHGRWFPRHSRALLYFGFSMLVASSVLFFAAQRDQVTGGPAQSDFNTDFWPQSGLITLGIPMLLCFALLKLGRLRAKG
ncbi:MAG TPA: hypothetical protein VF134_08820 [Candidatus Dormibacteraeota bacterium]